MKVSHYVKRKGEKSFKKVSGMVLSNDTIKNYLKYFNNSYTRKNPDYTTRSKYSNFGHTYTSITKNKKTGKSTMLVLEEKY